MAESDEIVFLLFYFQYVIYTLSLIFKENQKSLRCLLQRGSTSSLSEQRS